MRELAIKDIIDMPSSGVSYLKSVVSGGILKWIPASLIAVLVDIQDAFGALFWIVGIMWMCDFIIGTSKAWMEDPSQLEWSKSFRSVIKLFVMGFGVLSIHLIEHMLLETGVNVEGKLTGAALLIIGSTEAISIMDNLSYFFPGLDTLTSRIKELLSKGRKNGGD